MADERFALSLYALVTLIRGSNRMTLVKEGVIVHFATGRPRKGRTARTRYDVAAGRWVKLSSTSPKHNESAARWLKAQRRDAQDSHVTLVASDPDHLCRVYQVHPCCALID